MNKTLFLKLLACVVLIASIGLVADVYSSDAEVVDPFALPGMANQSGNQQFGQVELYVESVMLKFLNAEDIKQVISSLNSEHGYTSVDKKTNSLVMSDTRKRLDRMVEEIRKADRTPKQIVVDVVIADVQIKDDTEFGVDWDYQSSSFNFLQKLIPDTLVKGGAFTFLDTDINVTLKALQQSRDVEILANPKVMVLSGQDALIKTIEEIPYTEVSDSTGAGVAAITTTKFKDAGITMTVRAVITDKGKILLEVEPDQSVNTGVAGVGDSTVPIIDRRLVKTTLLMKDGQVAVMGGLRRKDIRIIKNKVPLLGDLPILGFLFSNDKKVIERSELMVFISPHIYDEKKLSQDKIDKFNALKKDTSLGLSDSERAEFEFLRSIFSSLGAE